MKTTHVRVAIRKSNNFQVIELEETCELSDNDNPKEVRKEIHEELLKEYWNLAYIDMKTQSEELVKIEDELISDKPVEQKGFYDRENEKNANEPSYLFMGLSNEPKREGKSKNGTWAVYDVFVKDASGTDKTLSAFNSITDNMEIGEKYQFVFDEKFTKSIKKAIKAP